MRAFAVHFRAAAIADLDELFTYFAQQSSPEIADGYLARLEDAFLSLGTFPHRGRAVAGRVEGLRVMGFERRVALLFRVNEDRVDILRILYGGQNLEPVIDSLPGN